MDSAAQAQVMHFIAKHLDTIPFKTLRHNETELSNPDKLAKMESILTNDPALFLSKWSRYLSQNTLRLFQPLSSNYEVNFYLASLLYQEQNEEKVETAAAAPPPPPSFDSHNQNHSNKSALQILIQNRRYQFLLRVLRKSDYYWNDSIQLREPILFDQYVSQHVPAQEKTKPFGNEVTLVNRIFSNMDRKFVDDRIHEQKEMEEEQFEEEEEESDDEIIEKSTPTLVTKKKHVTAVNVDTSGEEDKDKDKDEDEDEEEEYEMDENDIQVRFRENQRIELVQLLEEKFLAGKDDFDYDQVDYNEEYDDLNQQERDIQDKYFDDGDDDYDC